MVLLQRSYIILRLTKIREFQMDDHKRKWEKDFPKDDDLLQEIAGLLSVHVADRPNSVHASFVDDKIDPDGAKQKIRSIYGSMGSFNNLIFLGPNRIPLRQENEQLDRMRACLFAGYQILRASSKH